MLLRFFRTNGAQIIIFIPFIGILLWLGPILNFHMSPAGSQEIYLPAYASLYTFIHAYDYIPAIVALVLVLSVAFLLVRINTRYILINNRTYLPAIVFVLLTSGIPNAQRLNPALFACFAILFMIEKILDSYRYEGLFYGFFTAAFVLGIGILFYPVFIFYQIGLWIGIALLRPFNWREWTFTILGVITPLIFALSYYYIVHDDAGILIEVYKKYFTTKIVHGNLSTSLIIFLILLAVISLISSQYLIQLYPTRKIVSRRAFSMFFWLFILTLVLFALVNQAYMELIYILSIPLSFLLSNYWVFVKSGFWGNLLLWLLLGSIVYSQFTFYYTF